MSANGAMVVPAAMNMPTVNTMKLSPWPNNGKSNRLPI
jgi:hypothetical protein